MHALHLHDRDMRGLAVIFLDLDDFKLVNDSLGHPAGDDLLTRLGQRLQGPLRNGDTLARMGGDEFAVLLEDVDDEDDAWTVATKLFQATATSFVIDGTTLSAQLSVGLTVVARDVANPSAGGVLAQADTAMYAAKRTSKGSLQLFARGMTLSEAHDEGLRKRMSLAPGDLILHDPDTRRASSSTKRNGSLPATYRSGSRGAS